MASYDEAEEYADQLAQETGRTFIHAFNDGWPRYDWIRCNT